MEFYEVFISFLRILKQSIKLFLKNWISLASVAILTQLLVSISVLLYNYIHESLNSAMKDAFMAPYLTPTPATSSDSSQSIALIMLKYFAPLLVVSITFIFFVVIISNFSSFVTILILVASCREKTLSLQDFISIIRKTCTKKLVTGFSIRHKRMPYWTFVGLLGIIPWMMNPNLITLLIAIFFVVIVFIFQVYQSVELILAMVVTAIEDSYKGKEALEKAEQLIEGQKIQGFLVNMFLNLLAIVSFVGCWLIVGDKWMLNFPGYWLFAMINIASLVKMVGLVAYTVLYSEGKKRCGEEIEFLGTMEYTKLSNDIP